MRAGWQAAASAKREFRKQADPGPRDRLTASGLDDYAFYRRTALRLPCRCRGLGEQCEQGDGRDLHNAILEEGHSVTTGRGTARWISVRHG